ncbi:hypothetical protein FRC18_006868 [Serendipita sp. 400]|nr:hypothetical protein FRC18_006868 [Serendipita sp. 400]
MNRGDDHWDIIFRTRTRRTNHYYVIIVFSDQEHAGFALSRSLGELGRYGTRWDSPSPLMDLINEQNERRKIIYVYGKDKRNASRTRALRHFSFADAIKVGFVVRCLLHDKRADDGDGVRCLSLRLGSLLSSGAFG